MVSGKLFCGADIPVRGRTAFAATVKAEDSNVFGGLGGAVAEALARPRPTPVCFAGAQDTISESGDPDSLWRKYKLDAPAIAEAAKQAIAAK